MELEKFQRLNRRPAVKTTIKEVFQGEFVQEDEQAANYLFTRDGRKLFRVNIAAAILHKEMAGSITNILIDDGSEKIILRSFEENKAVRELAVGDAILIIGKVRAYNKEKYISPEIVKKIDPLWLRVRSLELKNLQEDHDGDSSICGGIEDLPENEEAKGEKIEDDFLLPVEKLRKLILELDDGDGVPIEEVVDKSPLDKTEDLIQKMLEKGDIFQNTPGKIKIL